ncbi:MAG: hypothetical protein IK954_01010 [Clostridia bacterium]|nr:hypothetical protein [Clostridia bacterium]
MKKVLVLFLTLIVLLSISGCGTKEAETFDLCGTWKVSKVEYNGAFFSVEEWLTMEDDDFSDLLIVFKKGGQAYVFDDDSGDLENWLCTEDEVMIGEDKCSLIDQQIRYDYYGDIIYLEKISESQEIPKANNEDEDEDEDEEYWYEDEDENTEDSDVNDEESADASGESTNWREFLIEYEEWVDAYVAAYRQILENPLDTDLYAEYLDLLDETDDWTERAADIEGELTDADELMEFSDELLRIAEKMSDAIL